jgi:hypothetical protein
MTTRTVPIICEPNEHNSAYLHAKRLFEMEHAKEVLNFFFRVFSIRVSNYYHNKKTPMLSVPEAVGSLLTFQKEVPIQLPSLQNISELRIGIIRTCWNDVLVESLSEQCKQVLVYSLLPPSRFSRCNCAYTFLGLIIIGDNPSEYCGRRIRCARSLRIAICGSTTCN